MNGQIINRCRSNCNKKKLDERFSDATKFKLTST